MTSNSLTGSLRTCKAKTSNDVRHYSSRVIGDNILCTVPRERDIVGRDTALYGRDVESVENCSHPSFQDRMIIEQKVHRPQYISFIGFNNEPLNNERARTGVNMRGHLNNNHSTCGN